MNHFAKVAGKLTENGMDGMLLTCEANRLYGSGFFSSGFDGMAVVTKNKNYYLTDFRYIEAAREKVKDAEILMVRSYKDYFEKINNIIAENGISKMGFEDACMTVSEFSRFTSELKCQLVYGSKMLLDIRQSKDEYEIEQMIKAQRIAESALEEVLNDIRVGVTEREIAARIMYLLLSKGAEDKSFDPIVVSGKNSSMPHGVPTDKPIEEGDFVTMDFGCKYNGYCSDMTRTVAVGHATDEMVKVYNIVLEAQLKGISEAKAGISGAQVDAAARDVIKSYGYGEYFGHSFGHGVGIEIHESPNLSPANQAPLPVNAVVSAEPGIYLMGKFGVRIEDVLVLKENGCENITKANKNLIIL